MAAYVATGLVWLPMLPNGIFYPVFDSANLDHSWGGPTLAGAWAAHLGIGAGLLMAVALPFALWRPPAAVRPRDPDRASAAGAATARTTGGAAGR